MIEALKKEQELIKNLLHIEFNEKEMELIEKIREAKQYVKGEIELDLRESEDEDDDTIDGWYALDYQKDWEYALSIDNDKYDDPIITAEEAEKYNVNVVKCCDYLDILYVG